MRNVVRNLLAVVAGFIIGGIVNMALVMAGPSLIPVPAGVNVNDPASLSSSMHLLEPQHFVMPFLAHALGTLAGALAAYLIAGTHRAVMAYVIGAFFLAGGVAAAFMIPAPAWVIALDLVLAYLPMAWVAVQLGRRMTRERRDVQVSAA